jgi:hypothetical protein
MPLPPHFPPITPDDEYNGTFPAFNRLAQTLQFLYLASIKAVSTTPPGRYEKDGMHSLVPDPFNGINTRSSYGIVAFPLAVSIWESFLNFHTTVEPVAQMLYGPVVAAKAQAYYASIKKTKPLSTVDRALDIPQKLFGKTYDKTKYPFTDFSFLVTIRNRITHDEASKTPKDAVAALRKKNLLLPREAPNVYTWAGELETTEVIRWCLNTVSDMADEFMKLLPAKIRNGHRILPSISEKGAKRLIAFHMASGARWDSAAIFIELMKLHKKSGKE